MSDPSLSSGDGWVLCCICFERHERPYPNLATDEEGFLTDVCKGQCAIEAGLVAGDE